MSDTPQTQIHITPAATEFMLAAIEAQAKEALELSQRELPAEIPGTTQHREDLRHVAIETLMNVEDARRLPKGKSFPLSELMAWAANVAGGVAATAIVYSLCEMVDADGAL